MLKSFRTHLLFKFLNPSANILLQKRFQNDMSINNSTVEVLQDQQWVPIPSRKVQVGDIIKVYFLTEVMTYYVIEQGCTENSRNYPEL